MRSALLRASGLLATLACIVCSAPMATAQRTWVVDFRNGAGTNFTDLPAALAAANDGDTIMMRGPGGPPPSNGYTSGTTGKALTLLGVGRPNVSAPSYFAPAAPLRIAGVPGGRTFVMKGFDFSAIYLGLLPEPSALVIDNCQGLVHLEDIGTGNRYPCSLQVTSCASVTIHRCLFGLLPTISPALRMNTSGATVTSSVVAMSQTSLGGDAAGGGYYHGICNNQTPSTPALSTNNATVFWSGGTLFGGDGFDCGFPGTPLPVPGETAVVQQGGLLVLTGDTNTSCRAGVMSATEAIHSNGGTLLLSPDVRLVYNQNFWGVGGNSRIAIQSLPFLSGAGAAAGLPVQLDLFASLGDAGILLASYPAPAQFVPPFGYLWLSPSLFVVGTVVFSTGRHGLFNLQVPAGTPDGMVFSFQGAAGNAAGVTLSNPAALILH